MRIGNDLIDLRARDTGGKADDDRFVQRVFTRREIDLIRQSPDRDLTLWMLWAGKEAVYKVAKKMSPAALFAHRCFDVVPGSAANEITAGTERVVGWVELAGVAGVEKVRIPVEWERTAELIHCIALEAPAPGHRVWRATARIEDSARMMDEYFPSERERASIRTRQSLAVRGLARAVAIEAGLGPVEIVRDRAGAIPGPPLLFAPGAGAPLPGWDVSLSHDGDHVAAVLVRDHPTPTKPAAAGRP